MHRPRSQPPDTAWLDRARSRIQQGTRRPRNRGITGSFVTGATCCGTPHPPLCNPSFGQFRPGVFVTNFTSTPHRS